jgi:hypothetical protein
MKKTGGLILLCMAVTLFAACSKKEGNAEGINEVWVLERYENDRVIYKPAADLEADKPGFIFYNNGSLADRKILGWCATPPVVYENYKGQWQLTGGIYNISSAYWGGTENYRLEIISRNGNEIVTKRL